ncbi:MAG: leucyl aminopeptidase [Minicystis sp.]
MPIKLSLSSTEPLSIAADLLVLGVPEGSSMKEGALGDLSKALGPSMAKAVKREEFTGKKDQTIELSTGGSDLKPARVLLIGLGKPEALTEADVRNFAAKGARFSIGAKATSLAIEVPVSLPGGAAERAAAEGVVLGAYRFTKYLTGDRIPKAQLERASLVVHGKAGKDAKDAVALGQKIGEAICIARDLINEPPNELYPAALADRAVEVAKANGLEYKVFDRPQLEKRGMKLIVAVGQGSARDPRMIHLIYKPKGGAKKKVAFVGKGLTFDTGGICIKPAQGMEEMKGDMGGAANIVALMAAVAALEPNVEVHGLIGSAENMPDGAAYRPGDIFGSYDGKTVEIINTDAEGRLVLADVLAYVAKDIKPDLVLDNATLTGACVVALGTTVSGFYANRDELAEKMKKASKAAGEAMWHMPLVEDLREGLKSDWADLKHVADRWGGSITAALFLREFVGETPWVHVDIAGPSMANKAYGIYAKGGTGHGVLTFLKLIEEYASA